MDIYSQFISNQNKGMLWKILCDNGTFNNIPDSKSTLVKIDFDRKVAMIGETIINSDKLVELNKRTISEMVQNISKYENSIGANAIGANAIGANAIGANAIGANAIGANAIMPNYNSADISQQRQKVFENELKQKQNEFEKFNNKPVPGKIDFSDKPDTPLGSEMDKILAEQIALREKQLNTVLETQDKTAASKWLQNGKESVQLTIGENIKLEEHELISSPKKVHFIEPVKDDFLSLLKKTTPIIQPMKPIQVEPLTQGQSTIKLDDIKVMLSEILNKQNKILDLLLNKIEE
jgi:hypothetical protein